MECQKLFPLNSHWNEYEMLDLVQYTSLTILVQTKLKKLDQFEQVFRTKFVPNIKFNLSAMIACLLLMANIHLISAYHSISATEPPSLNIDHIDPRPYQTGSSNNQHNLQYNSFDAFNGYNLYRIYRPIALQMNQLLLLTSNNINQQKSINTRMLMKTTDDCR